MMQQAGKIHMLLRIIVAVNGPLCEDLKAKLYFCHYTAHDT